MNAAQVIDHFDRICNAPDAIPRLRRFILDLAVRGRLVEQDPNDEPAFELLKRFQAEKARLVKEGKIKDPRILDHSDDDGPFRLPSLWTWCRLSEVGTIVGGGTPPSADWDNFTSAGSGIAWLTPADLGKQTNLYVSHGARDLIPQGLRSSSATLMPKGSVLFTSRAPIGYTAIAANEVSTNQGFKSVVPYILACNLYIAVYFRAFGKWIDGRASGTTFREVSGKIVASLPFPLAPIAEQHRIVAKVDQLMALCDRLESAQRERESRRGKLAVASLHRLNNGADADEFREHARFHIHHLPRLTTRPEHIQQLRQTILNLAVRGKLVSQDPSDETASELLKRIHADKHHLMKKGTNPQKKLTSIMGRFLFAPPETWELVSFGNVCNQVTSGSRGWAEFCSNTGPKFIRAQNIRFGRLLIDNLACVNPPNKSEGKRTRVSKGDLLIVITGAGVTNPALVDRDLGEAYVSQHVALIKPAEKGVCRWLLLCLMAPVGGRSELVERAYGAGKPGLNLDNIRSLTIPLPPLAEQHRIVAKVNELMALCDRLEAQLITMQSESRRLLDAVLNEALSEAN